MINNGMGSVLYIVHNGNIKVSIYCSAKLKTHQQRWLPCELEALAINASLNHWRPYILESYKQTQVLSDSKPCIQVLQKLNPRQFSSSARVSTFSSTTSRYNINVQHLSGSANLPADYSSCSPMECKDSNCQVCKFIAECENYNLQRVCNWHIRR